jgi:hypothetical protein
MPVEDGGLVSWPEASRYIPSYWEQHGVVHFIERKLYVFHFDAFEAYTGCDLTPLFRVPGRVIGQRVDSPAFRTQPVTCLTCLGVLLSRRSPV